MQRKVHAKITNKSIKEQKKTDIKYTDHLNHSKTNYCRLGLALMRPLEDIKIKLPKPLNLTLIIVLFEAPANKIIINPFMPIA